MTVWSDSHIDPTLARLRPLMQSSYYTDKDKQDKGKKKGTQKKKE
jgi:hypothetical protein